MRQRIEEYLAAEEALRRRRAAISRDADPHGWATIDAAWTEARDQISAAGREAVRSLGLARELNRALTHTGFATRNIGMDLNLMTVLVELEGEPESPSQLRRAADPAVYDTVRRVVDEFHSRTGMEVRFPFARLDEFA